MRGKRTTAGGRVAGKRDRRRIAVGVDGCPGGWLAVSEARGHDLTAKVFPAFDELVGAFPSSTVIGVDIPIGLPERGARQCDLDVRQFLGVPRMASVFPAPLRACLAARSYEQACSIRFRIEEKRMSRQAFGILAKCREVDEVIRGDRRLAKRVSELHPEVSFALMNDGQAMLYVKKSAAGKAERRALLEAQWPGAIDPLRMGLRGQHYAIDDLHDALAALWSARRWADGEARCYGDPAARDSRQLPMNIWG